MTSKPGRGGLRNPAGGRPSKPKEERRRKVIITLDPDVVDWLNAKRARENEPLSQVIERLLKKRKG
jgi:hypothetical protein